MSTTILARDQFTILIPPALEPVSVADVKAALGIDDSGQDARIALLIRSARELAEAYTGRAFMTQTIRYQLDGWPGTRMPWWSGTRIGSRAEWDHANAPIELPRAPLQSIVDVTWFDRANDPHIMDPDGYYADTVNEPGRLVAEGLWPTGLRSRAAVQIDFVAGYGSMVSAVPAAVGEAILSHIADTYQRPNAGVSSERIDNASVSYGAGGDASGGGSGIGAGSGLRGGAAALLAPLRIRPLGY